MDVTGIELAGSRVMFSFDRHLKDAEETSGADRTELGVADDAHVAAAE